MEIYYELFKDQPKTHSAVQNDGHNDFRRSMNQVANWFKSNILTPDASVVKLRSFVKMMKLLNLVSKALLVLTKTSVELSILSIDFSERNALV